MSSLCRNSLSSMKLQNQAVAVSEARKRKKIRRDLFNWLINIVIVGLLTRLKLKTWLVNISGPPRSPFDEAVRCGSDQSARQFKASTPPAAVVQTVCSASRTDSPGGGGWGYLWWNLLFANLCKASERKRVLPSPRCCLRPRPAVYTSICAIQ